MALTTAQQVRLKIQDPYRWQEEIIHGDGKTTVYQLLQGNPHSQIVPTATAYVFLPAPTGWSATAGTTADHALGTIELAGIVSAGTGTRVTYQWSVFSDDEIGHFTAIGGTVDGAALEAIETLMFDAYKRARWQSPDGSEYDDTKALDNLMKMHSALDNKIKEADGPAGGFESWSVEQGNYP